MSKYQNELTSDDKIWGLMAYVLTPIVPVIVLLLEEKRKRPFIRTHSIQALVWGLALALLVSILSSSFILSSLAIGIGIAGFIINILWGIKAYNGEKVTIPFITEFVEKQNWV